jgi:hypothetical protein
MEPSACVKQGCHHSSETHSSSSSQQSFCCNPPSICFEIQEIFEEATITSCAQAARELEELWHCNGHEGNKQCTLQTLQTLFRGSTHRNVVSHRIAVFDLVCELHDRCPLILQTLHDADAFTQIFTMPPSIYNLFLDFETRIARSGPVNLPRPERRRRKLPASHQQDNGETRRHPSFAAATDAMTDLYRVIHASSKLVKLQQGSLHYELDGDESLVRMSHDAQVLERVLSRVCCHMWQRDDFPTTDNYDAGHGVFEERHRSWSLSRSSSPQASGYSTSSSSAHSQTYRQSPLSSSSSWGQYSDGDDDGNYENLHTYERGNKTTRATSCASREYEHGVGHGNTTFWGETWVQVVALVTALNVQLDSAIARLKRRLKIKLLALSLKDEALVKLERELISHQQSVEDILVVLDNVQLDFENEVNEVFGDLLTAKMDTASARLVHKINQYAKQSSAAQHINGFLGEDDGGDFHEAQVRGVCYNAEQRQLDDVIREQLANDVIPLAVKAQSRIQDLLDDVNRIVCQLPKRRHVAQIKCKMPVVEWTQFTDELAGFVPEFGVYVRSILQHCVLQKNHRDISSKNAADRPGSGASTHEPTATLNAAAENLRQRHAAMLLQCRQTGWTRSGSGSALSALHVATAFVVVGGVGLGIVTTAACLKGNNILVARGLPTFTVAVAAVVVTVALAVTVRVTARWLTIRSSRQDTVNTHIRLYRNALFGVMRVAAMLHTHRLRTVQFMAGPSVERKLNSAVIEHSRACVKTVLGRIRKSLHDVRARIRSNNHARGLLDELVNSVQCISAECPPPR